MYCYSTIQNSALRNSSNPVANPEGVQGVRLNPSSPPPPVFKYPMKMKEFGLSETKLFI